MMTIRESYTRAEQLTGALRVAGAAMIWGLIPLFLRLSDGSTVVKIWVRVLAASIVMLGYLALRGRLGWIRALGKKKVGSILIQGVVLAVNWLFFLHALDGEGSIALAELLGYTSPVIIALLAPMVLGERFDPRVLLPLLLAIVGFTTMLAPSGFSLEGEAGMRALWGLCAAFTIAFLNLRGKKIIAGVPGEVFLVLQHLMVFLVLSPWAISLLIAGRGPSNPTSWLSLTLGLGGLCTVVAGLIHLEGFRRIRVDHSAILCYMEPVSAIAFTALLPTAVRFVPVLSAALPERPEHIGLWTVVGGALVITAGVAIIKMETKPEVEPMVPFSVSGVIIEEDAETA